MGCVQTQQTQTKSSKNDEHKENSEKKETAISINLNDIAEADKSLHIRELVTKIVKSSSWSDDTKQKFFEKLTLGENAEIYGPMIAPPSGSRDIHNYGITNANVDDTDHRIVVQLQSTIPDANKSWNLDGSLHGAFTVYHTINSQKYYWQFKGEDSNNQIWSTRIDTEATEFMLVGNLILDPSSPDTPVEFDGYIAQYSTDSNPSSYSYVYANTNNSAFRLKGNGEYEGDGYQRMY